MIMAIEELGLEVETNYAREAHDYELLIHAHIDLAIFEAGLIEAVQNVIPQLKKRRARNLRPGVQSFELPNTLKIRPDMSEEERVEVMNGTYTVINGTLNGYSSRGRIAENVQPPEVIEWNSPYGYTETSLFRFNGVLGLAESVYRDKDGNLQVHPELWIGRESDMTPEVLERNTAVAA
jgi:hypothetical protein